MQLTQMTESRDEYYSFELALAARRLVEEVLEVERGQQVVITADTQADQRVVWATASAVFAARAVPVVLYYPTQLRSQSEPPAAVAAAVASADVWIEFAVGYTIYTRAWHHAIEAGVQFCELDGLDVDGFVRCIGQQDINILNEMGEELIRILSNCAQFRITSAQGTDITLSNTGVEVGVFKMKKNPQRIPIMLAGQVSWLPVEASLCGRIVADGILYPPTEVGVLTETVELQVESGRITSIQGGRTAQQLQRWIDALDDPTLYRIAHASYGFNPGVMVLTGRAAEDERAFGCFDFGWGAWIDRPAAGHFDISVLNASTWADGVQITQNGVFVHPKLAELCRAMGVPRH